MSIFVADETVKFLAEEGLIRLPSDTVSELPPCFSNPTPGLRAPDKDTPVVSAIFQTDTLSQNHYESAWRQVVVSFLTQSVAEEANTIIDLQEQVRLLLDDQKNIAFPGINVLWARVHTPMRRLEFNGNHSYNSYSSDYVFMVRTKAINELD